MVACLVPRFEESFESDSSILHQARGPRVRRVSVPSVHRQPISLADRQHECTRECAHRPRNRLARRHRETTWDALLLLDSFFFLPRDDHFVGRASKGATWSADCTTFRYTVTSTCFYPFGDSMKFQGENFKCTIKGFIINK